MSQSNPNPGPFDVFLCHNSADKPEVREIAKKLRGQGFNPWLDERDIPAGKSWLEVLDKQIDTIKAAAIFIGDSGIGRWQKEEIQAFLQQEKDRGCVVIPVVLPSATKEPKILNFLRNRQLVDLRKTVPDPYGQLKNAINRKESVDPVNTESLLELSSDNADKLNQAYKEGRRLYTRLVTPPDQEQLAQLRILLNHVQSHWVDGVLTESLHHEVSIALGKVLKEKAVEPRWEFYAPLPNTLRELLLRDRNITTLFDATELLLILGEPGSGKTTTLLELAKGLIDRAKDDPTERVPIVLNLSSWEQTKSLEEWIAAELSGKYQVSELIARAWLEKDYLVPLLDGLDELSTAVQVACVAAINAFIENHRPPGLVVCSRLAEYEWLPERLTFNGAICLEPLKPEDVDHFLETRRTQLAGLQQAVNVDPVLRELAQTPLMLDIMSLACAGVSKEALISDKGDTLEVRREHIFHLYVDRMFERKESKSSTFTKEKIIGWLSWLARTMKAQSRSVFTVEELRPSWLNSRAKIWTYSTVVALNRGMLGALIAGVIAWMFDMEVIGFGLLVGLGAIVGLASGLNVGLSNEICLIEAMPWKSMEFCKASIVGISLGLFYALVRGKLNCSNGHEILNIFPCWLLVGLSVGLPVLLFTVFGRLVAGLSDKGISTKVSPNQGITLSLKNGLVALLIVGLSFGVPVGIASGLLRGPSGGLAGVLLGVLLGGFDRGVTAVVQHYALRLILWLTGSTPLRFIPFLDHCANLILLKKVGGGYIFVHRILLEYFAGLPSQSPETSSREK